MHVTPNDSLKINSTTPATSRGVLLLDVSNQAVYASISVCGEDGTIETFSRNTTKLANFSKQADAGNLLLAFTHELLQEAKAPLHELLGIVVIGGPGSYTALRIVSSIAKMWCYVHSLRFFSLSKPQAYALGFLFLRKQPQKILKNGFKKFSYKNLAKLFLDDKFCLVVASKREGLEQNKDVTEFPLVLHLFFGSSLKGKNIKKSSALNDDLRDSSGDTKVKEKSFQEYKNTALESHLELEKVLHIVANDGVVSSCSSEQMTDEILLQAYSVWKEGGTKNEMSNDLHDEPVFYIMGNGAKSWAAKFLQNSKISLSKNIVSDEPSRNSPHQNYFMPDESIRNLHFVYNRTTMPSGVRDKLCFSDFLEGVSFAIISSVVNSMDNRMSENAMRRESSEKLNKNKAKEKIKFAEDVFNFFPTYSFHGDKWK